MKWSELWKQFVAALAPRSKSQDRRRIEKIKRQVKRDEQHKRDQERARRKR